jgi:hypothetical protein
VIEVALVYALMVVAISYITIKEDRVQKGFKANAKDGDGDGWIQEGTKWERKVKR